MAKLIFYYGSMNSSKTANLIMAAYNLKSQNKPFVALKPAMDTRSPKIVSRAVQSELDCHLISDSKQILDLVASRPASTWPTTIFVDEVQFMSIDCLNALIRIVDLYGIDVICYGLLTDFQAELFESSKYLVENADAVREIKNQCHYCSNKAIRNMRLLNEEPTFQGDTIMVGYEESYRAVCRACYNQFLLRKAQ